MYVCMYYYFINIVIIKFLQKSVSAPLIKYDS